MTDSNFNNNDLQDWLKWLNYHRAAPQWHVQHDKYHTSKHRESMHNKFWYCCCMELNCICIVGIPAGHHKSNVGCDIYEHEKEYNIGCDHLPIPTDSVPLSPL